MPVATDVRSVSVRTWGATQAVSEKVNTVTVALIESCSSQHVGVSLNL